MAIPGISGSLLLAASRAIGETMIVVMAAGLAANLTANPLEAVTTITAQIVALLTGDQEFDSAKTLSAFALGLLLFIVTLILNMISTATMIQLGHIRGNKMVDMQMTNAKLKKRAIAIIQEQLSIGQEAASTLLSKHKSIRKAIDHHTANE